MENKTQIKRDMAAGYIKRLRSDNRGRWVSATSKICNALEIARIRKQYHKDLSIIQCLV